MDSRWGSKYRSAMIGGSDVRWGSWLTAPIGAQVTDNTENRQWWHAMTQIKVKSETISSFNWIKAKSHKKNCKSNLKQCSILGCYLYTWLLRSQCLSSPEAQHTSLLSTWALYKHPSSVSPKPKLGCEHCPLLMKKHDCMTHPVYNLASGAKSRAVELPRWLTTTGPKT